MQQHLHGAQKLKNVIYSIVSTNSCDGLRTFVGMSLDSHAGGLIDMAEALSIHVCKV